MAKFKFQTKDWVLTRDCVSNNVWGLGIFSHKKGNECVTIGGLVWDEGSCIPYNETTKHLCGTSDPYIDPAEAPAFEFGDVVEIIGSCVKGIYSKSEETYDEVLLKGIVTTRTYEKGNLRLIRKGNFND